ncbi:MAG: hypothetical protein LUD07_12460 [Clostridiales bacterium]|nr:hypothetical protein [Clostridiales bacterium]
MMTLFNDEYIIKTYIESERKEAAHEAAQETAKEIAKKTTLNLREMGMSVCDIAKAVNMPEKQVEEWLGLVVS